MKTLLYYKRQEVEYLTCIKYFMTKKIIKKRPGCYLRYLELLTLPVIEVRYLAINYQIIKPKDRSIPHRILCQLLAAFLYSFNFKIWRMYCCGKQILI